MYLKISIYYINFITNLLKKFQKKNHEKFYAKIYLLFKIASENLIIMFFVDTLSFLS